MPNTVDRVEVFAGIQRRRRYTLEQKLAAVAEASQPGMSISFVEKRLAAAVTPHPIQWLSDNGSCYRAYETIEFAMRLGLVPCCRR